MLERGDCSTYHEISVKHLQRWVKEFTGRHDIP